MHVDVLRAINVQINSEFGAWYLIALGLIAVVVMLYFPGGLWGAVSKKFDLHLFPVRRWLRSGK